MRAKIPTYAIVKDKTTCPARDVAPALRYVQEVYRNEQIDMTDGLKIVWPDRWVSARGSNTEPIIRVTAEAPTDLEARALSRDIIAAIDAALGRVPA